MVYWQFGIIQVLLAEESTILPLKTTNKSNLICETNYSASDYYLNNSVLVTSDICNLLQLKGEVKQLSSSENNFENVIEVLTEITDYYIFAKVDETPFLYLNPRSPPESHFSI